MKKSRKKKQENLYMNQESRKASRKSFAFQNQYRIQVTRKACEGHLFTNKPPYLLHILYYFFVLNQVVVEQIDLVCNVYISMKCDFLIIIITDHWNVYTVYLMNLE